MGHVVSPEGIVMDPGMRHRTLPPSQDGLQGYHVSSGSGSRLPDRKGSGAATYIMAPDPSSLQGRAPVHHVLRILPPCKGWLRCVTCPTTPDPASLQERAPMHHMSYSSRSYLPSREGFGEPRVLQLQILPPSKGGLRCVTCPTAPDPTSLQGRALEHRVF
jgi:hypothetical protein